MYFESMELIKGIEFFLFMPRSPEFYISFLGILKVGAIAGPLFEAFMEQAVRDRLQDSAAKMLITTPELLYRVPQSDLPDLEKIILVGEFSEQKTNILIIDKKWKRRRVKQK
jgi:acetyl-CoA synthetase